MVTGNENGLYDNYVEKLRRNMQQQVIGNARMLPSASSISSVSSRPSTSAKGLTADTVNVFSFLNTS